MDFQVSWNDLRIASELTLAKTVEKYTSNALAIQEAPRMRESMAQLRLALITS